MATVIKPKKAFTTIKKYANELLIHFKDIDVDSIKVANTMPAWLSNYITDRTGGSVSTWITFLICEDLANGFTPNSGRLYVHGYKQLVNWFVNCIGSRTYLDWAIANKNTKVEPFTGGTDLFNHVLFEYYNDLYKQIRAYVEKAVNEINYISEEELP